MTARRVAGTLDGRRRRRRVKDGGRQLEGGVAPERQLAAGQLLQEHAQRPHIAMGTGWLASQYLRRHVGERAANRTGGGDVVALDDLDRNRAVELGVECAADDAHAAHTKFPLDAIVTKGLDSLTIIQSLAVS